MCVTLEYSHDEVPGTLQLDDNHSHLDDEPWRNVNPILTIPVIEDSGFVSPPDPSLTQDYDLWDTLECDISGIFTTVKFSNKAFLGCMAFVICS